MVNQSFVVFHLCSVQWAVSSVVVCQLYHVMVLSSLPCYGSVNLTLCYGPVIFTLLWSWYLDSATVLSLWHCYGPAMSTLLWFCKIDSNGSADLAVLWYNKLTLLWFCQFDPVYNGFCHFDTVNWFWQFDPVIVSSYIYPDMVLSLHPIVFAGYFDFCWLPPWVIKHDVTRYWCGSCFPVLVWVVNAASRLVRVGLCSSYGVTFSSYCLSYLGCIWTWLPSARGPGNGDLSYATLIRSWENIIR